MTRIRLLYVHAFVDRHGRPRYYVRRPGRKRVTLKGIPGSDEFMAAYQAAIANLRPQEIGVDRTKPGTVNAAVIAYYASADFAGFAAATQAMRRAILERFRADHAFTTDAIMVGPV